MRHFESSFKSDSHASILNGDATPLEQIDHNERIILIINWKIDSLNIFYKVLLRITSIIATNEVDSHMIRRIFWYRCFPQYRTWVNSYIFLCHLGIKFPTKDKAMNIWKLYSREWNGDLSSQDQGDANENGMNLFMLQRKKFLVWLPNRGRIPTRQFLFEIKCKL